MKETPKTTARQAHRFKARRRKQVSPRLSTFDEKDRASAEEEVRLLREQGGKLLRGKKD